MPPRPGQRARAAAQSFHSSHPNANWASGRGAAGERAVESAWLRARDGDRAGLGTRPHAGGPLGRTAICQTKSQSAEETSASALQAVCGTGFYPRYVGRPRANAAAQGPPISLRRSLFPLPMSAGTNNRDLPVLRPLGAIVTAVLAIFGLSRA